MQTKKMSIIESILNVSTGFIISTITWLYIIGPMFNINSDLKQSLSITFLFTIISIIRGYVWRRLFNSFEIKSFKIINKNKGY